MWMNKDSKSRAELPERKDFLILTKMKIGKLFWLSPDQSKNCFSTAKVTLLSFSSLASEKVEVSL